TFRNDANEKKRLLYIDVLNRIVGDKPLKPLIHQSLYDESRPVREAAVRGVRHSDVAMAVPIYLRALKNERNVIVNRAGTALGQLGDDSVVPLLIEALVTRHHYQTLVPDQTLSVTADGSMAPGGVPIPGNIAGLLVTGQLPQGIQVQTDVPVRTKEVTVEKEESNPSVLSALSLLTGEDFGFDEAAWRNWQKARVAGNLKPKKISSSSNATK
ncbi:MAG TPA: HEAT repeat domain-containing protein, partial [Planctomycetaceae bacterium]|nr:HEAT repeat domain-containing protein [Planctomycetaceae bacterium]